MTKERGRTGEAAKAVAKVLEPHFAKENAYALPPLGLLKPLSQGKFEPKMVEVLKLTDKLEAALNAIAGVDELRSSSAEGVSMVVVTFDLSKSADGAAQEVRDKVQAVLGDLPGGRAAGSGEGRPDGHPGRTARRSVDPTAARVKQAGQHTVAVTDAVKAPLEDIRSSLRRRRSRASPTLSTCLWNACTCGDSDGQ